jgi:hypothetical protein
MVGVRKRCRSLAWTREVVALPKHATRSRVAGLIWGEIRRDLPPCRTSCMIKIWGTAVSRGAQDAAIATWKVASRRSAGSPPCPDGGHVPPLALGGRTAVHVTVRVRARIATLGRALREKLCASWTDQLDEDASLDRPDLEVEVSEEVHPEQPVDAFMIEIEHLERKVRR